MYLKRLEMQGFKSFADKTVLEFMPGITTVIGPNGSGKSNISDAIRWVLGEQSMKSLRGTNSLDVIFAGTQSRKSLGFAEVSLVFDNSDRTEVTVTRKIYRSGESAYYINKTQCRLKDIIELFLDTGIGKDGYSIIGQGRIDEILSNKSEDRRHIFEEAAGIVKYKVRKIEAEKKLERTKLNLLRINDILSEIEQNLEPLKNQSEKAKKFLNLREELKNIEVGLFIHNIAEYKEKLEKIQIDEDAIKTQNEEANKKMEEITTLKTKLKEEVDSITENIEKMHLLSSENVKTREIINSKINVFNEKQANNNINMEAYKKEIQELNERNVELEKEKNQKDEKKNNLFKNKEKFEKELKEKEEELLKLTKNLSEKELEIEEKKKKLDNIIETSYEKNSEINTLDADVKNLEKREESLKFEIQSTISELDSTRITKEEISKSFNEIEFKKNEISKNIEEISVKREEQNKKIESFNNEINKILFDLRVKESKHKFLVLSKGVHGALSSLISTKKEYQTAIEMCLGGAIQNIVTDTEQDAKRLVEYLRENNLGRASFLPIATVKGKKLDKIISKNINGIIGVASDLIETKKEYEQIILNLLGKTVIVDDMDSAIALAKLNSYSFRIVTLKGDVINPSGMITGGSVAQKTASILGRTAEIENLAKQIQEEKKKIEKIQKEKEEYENQTSTTEEEEEALERSFQDIQIVYATNKQKLVAVNENVEKLENRLDKRRKELDEIKKQKEENRIKKEEIEKQQITLKEEKEKVSLEIQEYSELNKDSQKFIDDLNLDVTNLKISVSSFNESEISIDEMIERIKVDIDNNIKNIQNKENTINNLILENENIQNEIVLLNNQLNELESQVNTIKDDIEKLKEERMQKNENLEKLEKNITEQFETIENIKEAIVKIDVKKTKVQEQVKIDVKKTKVQEQVEEITNKLWDEYELTPNTVGEEYKKPENIQEATKQVNKLRNNIKDLGSVNIDSIEEYKETSKRYDFMCEQRLDVENTMAKLNKVIHEMTSSMKTQFTEQFKIINKNFGEVFRELFGGGKAELILLDENNILESGIDIQVQPPGKKLQNMTLLSGGEKAFTAIAILFAILKINPSPFCILDEIEAALDDVNVYRFAEYLKRFSNNVQFLTITHRKGTMEAGDTVYGVTMEENGISKLLSMKLK